MRDESWDTTKMHQLSAYIRTAEGGGNSAVHVYYVVLAGLLVVIVYVKLYLQLQLQLIFVINLYKILPHHYYAVTYESGTLYLTEVPISTPK